MDKEFLEKCLEQGMSSRQIAPLVNLSYQTVLYWIHKYNLQNKMNYKKPVYSNSHMFNKIDTKEKAYIIGYTLADGYISKNEQSIEFGCAINDKEILDFICKYIGAGKVREDKTLIKETRHFPKARYCIGNKDIFTDFLKHCSSKDDKHVPIVSKELRRYIVQGFFDGDGCITWGRRKDRNRIWHKISFTGQLKVLTGIQNILLDDCGISTKIRPKGNENCFVLEFANKKDVLKFCNYIYPDDSFIILHRKYEKYQALRLELGEFGEDPRTPSEAVEEIVTERVETNGCGNNKTVLAPEQKCKI